MTTILGQGVGQKDANIGQKKAVKNFVVQFYFFVRKIWPIQIIVDENKRPFCIVIWASKDEWRPDLLNAVFAWREFL